MTKKRLFSTFMALIMVCSMVMYLPKNAFMSIVAYAVSENDAISWMNSKNGTTITDGGTQCVAAFNAYLRLFGISNPIGQYPVGGAKQIFDFNAPSGWQKISGSGNYRVGDVVVWNGNVGGGSGHVGMVYSTSGTVKIFDQNWTAKNKCGIHAISSESSIRGVFRPPFSNPSTTHISCSAGTAFTPTSFWWEKSTNADSYHLKIWKNKLWEGDAYQIVWSLNTLSYKLNLPEGYYEAYVDAVNSSGCTMSENVVKFTVTKGSPVNLGNDFKAIILHTNSWKPIVLTDSGSVVLGTESRTNYDSTCWHFIRNSDDGSYAIYSYKNGAGMALDLDNYKDIDGANILGYKYAGTTNQRWYLIENAVGTYTLRPKCSNTRVMDLNGGTTTDNTNIQLWTMNNTHAQWFSIYKLDAARDKVNYTISADKTSVTIGTKVNISVGGYTSAVYDYKFHIIDPSGKETVINNKCNPVYSFSGSAVGKYIIFAEIKSPVNSDIGSKTNKNVTINVTCTHNYGDWTGTKAATCTSDGQQKRVCKVCGYIDYQTTKATGHKWNAPTYSWSADNKSCTATRVCANDSSHKETETVSTTYSITKQPTCTDKGTGTYTVTFKNSAFAKQTKNIDIPAKGHNWGAVTYSWSSDSKTCTATRVCANDSIKEMETVNTSYSVTKQPNCADKGTGTFAAIFKNTAFTKQTKNVDIPATGHSYTDKIVAPTPTSQGYTLHECSRCGDSYKTDFTDYKANLTIHYNTNGGSINSTDFSASDNDDVYKADGSAVNEIWADGYGHPYGLYNASTFGMYREGYEFLGWSLTLDDERIFGEDEKITSNDLYPDITKGDAAIKLYARWRAVPSSESNYPVVYCALSPTGRQFRLKWNAVPGAEKYGIAVYQSNRWRLKVQTTATSYTSPKLSKGTYKLAVCAKIGSKWDTSNIKSRAVTVTIS